MVSFGFLTAVFTASFTVLPALESLVLTVDAPLFNVSVTLPGFDSLSLTVDAPLYNVSFALLAALFAFEAAAPILAAVL